jgi:hypothetical protein
VGASERDVLVVEGAMGVSGCAVARQRECTEGESVKLLETCLNGGAFKQRNRFAAVAIVRE